MITKLNNDLDTIDALFSSTGTSVAMNLDGAVIDSSVIGGTTAAAGTFTTLTASGDLTVDTSTLKVDSTNNRVGIGTASPATKFDVITGSTGGFKLDDEATAGGVKITTYQGSTNSNVRNINFDVQNFIVSTGAPSGTSVSEALRVDNSGNVGIGETSPAPRLHVTDSDSSTDLTDANNIASFERAGNARVVIATNTGNTGSLEFGDSGGARQGRVSYAHSDDSLALFTAGSERARIDSSGKVGIGTASPLDLLHLESSSGDVRQLMNAPTDSDAEIKFAENGTVKYTIGHDAASDNFVIGTANVDTNQRFVIDSSGNVGINTTSPSDTLEIQSSGNDDGFRLKGSGGDNLVWLHQQATDSAIMRMYDGGTVKVLLDASGGNSYFTGGSLGIGTSSPSTLLTIQDNDNGTMNEMIRLVNDPGGSTAVGTGAYISFANHHSGTEVSSIRSIAETTGAGTGLQFYTHSGSSLGEKVRIDKDGKVGIGTSSPAEILTLVASSGDCNLRMEGSAVRIKKSGVDWLSYDGSNLKLSTGNNERMRIDSSGRVGIGTTSPSQLLHISSTGSAGILLEADSDNVNEDHVGEIQITQDGGATYHKLGTNNDNHGYINVSEALVFERQGSEKARIDTSGNLLIAASSFNGVDDSSVKGIALRATAGRSIHTLDSGANAIEFNTHNNGNAGEITCTGTSTTYSTSSDYRLKDVKDSIQNGLERTLALNPVEFEWKADGRMSEGFIAHEAQEIFADAVNGEKDGEKMQSMDYGRITPLLVKAIQEQQEQIEELKQQINELRGN